MFPIIGLLGERVLKTKGSFQNLAVNVCEAHTHRCSMETGLAAVGAKESKFKNVSGRRLGRISGGDMPDNIPKNSVQNVLCSAPLHGRHIVQKVS